MDDQMVEMDGVEATRLIREKLASFTTTMDNSHDCTCDGR
jgi:CheY-like chemotaxis protein